MNIPKNLIAKIEEISKATGLRVNSYKTINKGGESLVIEVNKNLIFRFPKGATVTDKMQAQWEFLTKFSKVSTISVPEPKYITDHFIGYKKISGQPFYPSQIEKLNEGEKLKIAKQLGLFLKILHGYKDNHIDFDTGYLVMRKKDYKSCPNQLVNYLTNKERRVLNTKLIDIANNPLNFKKPTSIIHGDLNFNNILWDKDKKIITGILDWSDMGLGAPAMDCIGIVDFNKKQNNQFLKDILTWYGTKDDNLFFQVKENTIIDIMNWFWFYLKTNNKKGMVKAIKKLKKVLTQNDK